MSLILSGTDGLSDVDGSAATPAIRGTDANTGIFFGADIIGFSEGGAECARFDSSGNLGIGTSSPAYKLDVTGTIRGRSDQYFGWVSGSQAGVWWAQTNYSVPSFQGLTSAGNVGDIVMQLGGANVGIGTASPSQKLDVQGNSLFRPSGGWTAGQVMNIYMGDTNAGITYTYTGASMKITSYDNLQFWTGGASNAERMRIDSSGNLLVGKTAADATTAGSAILPAYGGANIPAMTLAGASSSNSQLGYHQYSTSAAAFRFYVGYGGTVFATNTAITAISDIRLKENIRDLDDGLQKVMALQPRKFDWKKGKGADIKNARGFIAQEFEIVFPDMVEEWKDTPPEGEEPYKAVNANLIPTLVKAIQEQQALITALTARITALENK